MIRRVLITILPATCLLLAPSGLDAARGDSSRTLIEKLNDDDSIRGEESSKAWRHLFDAYLAMSPPPRPISDRFNTLTIWPGMDDWGEVSRWASDNPEMADAIIDGSKRAIIGLPYGRENVPATYSEVGLCVDIGIEEGHRTLNFSYLEALDTMSAYATAEIYRRFETGDVDGALALMASNLTVFRMFCDRQFMEEKQRAILILTESLANARDCFMSYMDRISSEQFRELALKELPYLRPDRARLEIPEHDRFVSEAVLKEVFDNETGDPIPGRFTEVFTRLQAEREPLTRLGAASRWREIALQHGGPKACQEKLELIYDDWWRRWRLREYGDVLTLPSEFDKANAMRYAGVLLLIENIQELFAIRNNLRVAVYGTALSAALCSFKNNEGVYPSAVDSKATRLYGTYVMRKLDQDPYYYREDLNGLDGFRYKVLGSRTSLDIGGDRIWLDAGEALLYSLGANEEDDLGQEHVANGDEGDIIIWPPEKVLLRENGFLK